MRSLTVQIPQPCHERWDEMQPTERGRFCASCQKTVVDYTAFSDQELVKLLSRSSETSCGRFRNEQLNRPLVGASSTATSVWRHWLGLLTMGLFGWQTARAQVSQTTKPAPPTSVRPSYDVTTLPIKTPLGGSATNLTVSGKVMLSDSSEKLSPAPNVHVYVHRPAENGYPQGRSWQTQTDSTGSFHLSVSIPMQAVELKVQVFERGRYSEETMFEATPSATSIALNDIILHESRRMKNSTGGGFCIVRKPSRWQKLKRSLFH